MAWQFGRDALLRLQGGCRNGCEATAGHSKPPLVVFQMANGAPHPGKEAWTAQSRPFDS